MNRKDRTFGKGLPFVGKGCRMAGTARQAPHVKGTAAMAMKVYSIIGDTTLLYSDKVDEGMLPHSVKVYFERDGEHEDFDFAEGYVPFCNFTRSAGFTDSELGDLRTFLVNNAPIILDLAYGRM